ncbi:MAG TPA: alkaline phosphatase family protein [Acidimicrobiia bacterium]
MVAALALVASACGGSSSRRESGGGGAPALPTTRTPYWRGWDIARSVVVLPGATGGYVLDGFGGLHPFGLTNHAAPAVPAGSPYWNGKDLARGLAVLPGGTGAYVLDAWGGVHAFGLPGHGAPAKPTTKLPYWPGFAIARSIAVLPDGTGGYVLDGFGGFHPFGLQGHAAPAVPSSTPYWPGHDLARSLVLLSDGTGGYVLDAFGGFHPFGLHHAAPPKPGGTPYWGGWDIARSVALFGDGSGYVLDGFGGFHPFAKPGSALPPASASPSVVRAAFYYPWFPGNWRLHSGAVNTNYHPTLGFYDNNQVSVVKSQIAAMQYGHISAGIASWWGPGSDTDHHMPTLMSAASGTGFKWSVYYENESLGDPSAATIRSDLTYLRDHYWSSPDYLRVDGKPVVFVYADANDGCGMAQRWKDANTLGAYVVLKVFPGYRSCSTQPQSWHQYGPASGAQNFAPDSYTVSPGFWKVGESARLPRDVSRFRNDVTAMAASGARFQLVTTFNEWGEGTAVESASEWATPSGYGAYLDVLHAVGVASLSAKSAPPPPPSRAPSSAPPPAAAPPAGTAAGPCGTSSAPPARYKHVIWVLMENKSWGSVVGNSAAPFETQLARSCGTATNWHDAGSQFNSEPSYIAMTSGQPAAVLTPFGCDCAPSPSVSLTTDNIFRQVRAAGGTERSWDEGMSGNCSSSGSDYAPKHNPALYYWGGSDRAACAGDDVPMGSATSGPFVDALRSDTLPTFSFVTPNLCNDTHDCGVATGDAFLSQLVPQIVNSPSYRRGDTALFVVWDEDTPIPNMVVAPSVRAGTTVSAAVSHYSLLRATEEMLGLPLLGQAASAPSLRGPFGV